MPLFTQRGFARKIQAEPSHRGQIAGLGPKPGARPKSKKALASFAGKGNSLKDKDKLSSDDATFGRRANSKSALKKRRGAAIRRERQEKIQKGELPDMDEEVARARGRWSEDEDDSDDPDSDNIDDEPRRPKQSKASSKSGKSTPAKSPKASSSKRKRPLSSDDESSSDDEPAPRKKPTARTKSCVRDRSITLKRPDRARSSPCQLLLPVRCLCGRCTDYADIPGGAEKWLKKVQAAASSDDSSSDDARAKTKRRRIGEEGPGKTPRNKLTTVPFSPPKTKVKKAAPRAKAKPKKSKAPVLEGWACPICDFDVRDFMTSEPG